jgi:hypothetical protein
MLRRLELWTIANEVILASKDPEIQKLNTVPLAIPV